MKIYTIGFTQKSAEQFFELLIKNEINLLLDVRLNNKSQLAGFAKGRDLSYFMEKICNSQYIHEKEFAPTEQILDDYKKKNIDWETYESQFKILMIKRNVEKIYYKKYKSILGNICLLCSEAVSDKCHRRLLAEYLKEYSAITGVSDIVHL